MKKLLFMLFLLSYSMNLVCADQVLSDDPTADIDYDEINELSGIINTSKPGEYWGVNDSGNAPILYRFNYLGMFYQKVNLKQIVNQDWEALSRDSNGFIYIGDIGDNDHIRSPYTIYRLKEPSVSSEQVDQISRILFHYEDRQSHNCEAMFFYDSLLHFITKENDKDNEPTLFKLDLIEGRKIQIATEVGKIPIKGRVTDAAFSQQTGLFVILTNDYLYLSVIEGKKTLLSLPQKTFEHNLDNAEALCIDDDHLIITSEDGKIWRYHINDLLSK